MGTRGAVGFILDNKVYATYNHYDSYPDGLGQEMINFCKDLVSDNDTLEIFKCHADNVILVNQQDMATPDLVEKYKQFSSTSVSVQKVEEWYCLLHSLQGVGILEQILIGNVNHMIDSVEFLKDSLFCEYAYLLNLDTEEIMFFEGFNTEPIDPDNDPLGFASFKPEETREIERNTYYPVKYLGSCPIDNIPDSWEDDFYPLVEEVVNIEDDEDYVEDEEKDGS
jgi:hypothetical protein